MGHDLVGSINDIHTRTSTEHTAAHTDRSRYHVYVTRGVHVHDTFPYMFVSQREPCQQGQTDFQT